MLCKVTDGLYVAYAENKINKIAAFDLDWTLIRSVKGKFFKSSSDWAVLPKRVLTLKKYRDSGYNVVIFTNQGYKGNMINVAIERINNFLNFLNSEGIYPWIFVSTFKDLNRKPNVGMFEMLEKVLSTKIDKTSSFYCGDAAGRVHDFSDDDLSFANNYGVKFSLPEDIFPSDVINIPETKSMFIFVGMPGAGKTTFYNTYLKPLGWIHINQDTLKTRNKVLSETKKALKIGKCIAIDSTNPSFEKRKDFINMAIEYNTKAYILYFVSNGYERNKLRQKPVPNIAYNLYYKNLEEPIQELENVEVIEIMT